MTDLQMNDKTISLENRNTNSLNKIGQEAINHNQENLDEDDNIIKNTDSDYNNLPNWPQRSPFEYYNKNVIVPENYKISSNNNNLLKDTEKLNPINDKINYIIHQNENKNIDNNENLNNIKISIVPPNLNENYNNIIINPVSEDKKLNIKEEGVVSSLQNYRKMITKQENNNNNNVEEKDIIYNFGYKKDERIEPLKLSLIKNTIGEYESKKKSIQNKIDNEKNNLKLLKKYENKSSNSIAEVKNADNNRNLGEISSSKKNIYKTEQELAYFKEKDLFDEEIEEKGLNITQRQMSTLDQETNQLYNYFKEISKRKKFEIIHPYLEYDRYNQREKLFQQSINKNLSLSQKNELKKMRLKPILQKQKSIINNIINKKYNINDINMKTNSNTISIETSGQHKYYPNAKNDSIYRSYSLRNYNDKSKYNIYDFRSKIKEEEWQKRQKLLQKQKQYSAVVLFNERMYFEEKKNLEQKNKKIQKIKINDNKFNINDINGINDINQTKEKDKYFINKDIKYPLIKEKKIKRDNNINENKSKVYISSFFPLKKYKLKKETKEDKINKIIKNNPTLDTLFHNHNMFNIKFENIKSHLK
jgi:hypothetical protein